MITVIYRQAVTHQLKMKRFNTYQFAVNHFAGLRSKGTIYDLLHLSMTDVSFLETFKTKVKEEETNIEIKSAITLLKNNGYTTSKNDTANQRPIMPDQLVPDSTSVQHHQSNTTSRTASTNPDRPSDNERQPLAVEGGIAIQRKICEDAELPQIKG